ncbi:helix-turn-helix domain-containing protein [Streptomyces sp. NBC_00390]|uniref:helix-turn-helix domain-containing protein n=1 Tax=Streptomyces sp. NBC_00390 TaxID=2975736 RepID=UPI002E1DFA6B
MAETQLNAPPCAPPPVPLVGLRHINVRHEERFVVIGNHLTQHPELSLTAIGLAVHIQSLRAGTRISIKKLAERFPEGEVRIADALRELEKHGYLARVQVRLPSGKLITQRVSYNNPPAMAAGSAPEHGPEPVPTPEPETPKPPEPKPSEPMPTRAEPEPRREALAAPVLPLPVAAALLADLRRHDPRLLLSERDVRRLAPAVDAWLQRDVTPDAVRRTLTAGLPDGPIHHPASLLAHRLTELLPPPLPATPPPPPRPDPLQNCDCCDRAFRAPEPGVCRGCDVSTAAA